MLSTNDLNQIQQRGITEQQVEHQLEQIKAGFPFLRIEAAAAIGKGIMAHKRPGVQLLYSWHQP